MADPTQSQDKAQKSGFFAKALNVAAYPISGLLGLWTTANDVHYAAYVKLKTQKRADGKSIAFGDLEEKYGAQYAENGAKLVAGSIDAGEFLSKDLAIKELHSPQVGARMAAAGLGNEWLGLKKLPQKWQFIGRDGKQRAVISGLTIAGISIGALLTIANSKSLGSLLGGKEKEDEISR